MARKSFLIVIACLLSCGGRQTPAQDRIWQPYIELEGRGNSIRQLGQGNLFLPLRQDCDSMLFADLRGLWTDGHAAEGNWGLAYRRITPGGWIYGGHLFYDLRHTELNNTFHQGTAGLELLNVNWGFRVNGYIPDQGVKAAPGANAAFLQGGNIVVRPGVEAAYWGVDFEAERLLWVREPCCAGSQGCKTSRLNSGECSDAGCFSRLRSIEAELWAAAGVFHFDNDSNGFENISGPRVRAELRLYDLPMIGNDSRLVVSGQYEYDDVRGSVGSGMLTVRIPFGPGGRQRCGRLCGINRRMVAPIVRDIDIVTNAGPFGPAEQAKFARTGKTISNVVFVDGNTADPEADIENAGADSLVIAQGGSGNIMPAGTIDMNDGQAVLGGGSSLAVIGCSTGARATFNAPGTRPTFSRAAGAGDIFGISNNNVLLQGLALEGGSNAVVIEGDSNQLSDLTISGFTGTGLDVGSNSGTSGSNNTFAQLSISGQGNFTGIDLGNPTANSAGNNTFTDVVISGPGNFSAVELGSTGNNSASNNTFTNLSISGPGDFTGIDLGSSGPNSANNNTFTNVSIAGTGGDFVGLDIGSSGDNSGSNNTFTNVSINGTGGDFTGIEVGSTGANSGSNNTFTNVTVHGTAASSGTGVDFGGPGNGSGSGNMFTNLSIMNLDTGIELGSSGPGSGSNNTFTNVTLRDLTDESIRFGSSGANSGNGNMLSNFTVSNVGQVVLQAGGGAGSGGSNNTFSNFTVSGVSGTAIQLAQGTAAGQNNTFNNFNVSNVTGDGLLLDNADNTTLNNSSFTNISGDVFDFTDSNGLSGNGNTVTSPFGNLFNDGGGNSGAINVIVDGVPTTVP